MHDITLIPNSKSKNKKIDEKRKEIKFTIFNFDTEIELSTPNPSRKDGPTIVYLIY